MTLSNDALKKISIIFSVAVALFLIILKLVAFIKTDSLAILSSLVDSITDLFASAISGVAIYFSMKPATYAHRYGYGKSEALSALLQSLFIAISGLFVIADGVNRLIHPVELYNSDIGVLIMVVSVLVTLVLVLFQTYVAKKTNSLAISADRAHYIVDFLTNGTVIISLILVKTIGFVYFDIIAAFVISIYLLYNAYSLAKEAIDMITDKELGDDVRNNIIKTAQSVENVRGVHDLRTRNLGSVYFIEMHIEIDGDMTLFNTHQITENVEDLIKEKYPNSQILIHQDPFGIDEKRLDSDIIF